MAGDFRLIVFDWDGTLMNSVARIVSSIQAAARDLDIAVPSERQSQEIIGLGLDEAVARLFSEESSEIRGLIVERYREHFLVLDSTQTTLFPGVEEVLASLSDDGYLLGVATGKSRKGLNRDLQQTGLGSLFHETRCADETFSKPHPQMLEELMLALGATPGETLMVGDTEYDMQLAVNAGASALGVTYGVHEADRLLETGALDTLEDLRELDSWLTSQALRFRSN